MTKPVLVTTRYRGVFFGHLNGEATDLPGSVMLTNARNCISWTSDVGGFLGLATKGPSKSCRIGTVVESLTLYDVTSVAAVTEAAARLWDDAKAVQ